MNPGHLLLAPPQRVARAIQQQLRSGQSLQQSYVFFVNATQRTINLYWINYKGQATFYLTLRPMASAKVNTFVQHPWIFRDRESGERMHVSHSLVFWPQSYHAPNPRHRGQLIPCRKQILVHFPVRSLRETCLWNLMHTLLGTNDARKFLSDSYDSDDVDESGVIATDFDYVQTTRSIERLCLPYTIKSDLMSLLRSHALHRSAMSGPATNALTDR